MIDNVCDDWMALHVDYISHTVVVHLHPLSKRDSLECHEWVSIIL